MFFSDTMRRNLLILCCCQALVMSAGPLIIATSGLVGLALAQQKIWATLPTACMFAGMLVITFPASILMKRIGRRMGFTLGLLVGLAGALLSTYAIVERSFMLFALGTFLIGITNGFGQYYRFAAAEVASAEYRGRAISWVMVGGVVAAFLGPNIANWSRDVLFGVPFAGSYASLLILYGLSLVLIANLRIPMPDKEERSGSQRPLWQVATQPAFLVAAVGALLAYGVMNLLMTATPLAMLGCGHDFGDTVFVIQWHVVAMYGPSFFTGHLIQRFGVTRIMSIGAVMLAACVAINLSGLTVMHFWAALVLLGLGWNFLFVGGTTLLIETYTPAEKAKAQGLNDLLVFGTVAMSALASGFLHQLVGWTALNYSVLPAIALALGATFWLGRRRANAASMA
jgi:MFS family permease